MSKKLVCLSDSDGQMRWFEEDELTVQLANADLLPDGAVKTMIRRFVADVRNMLDEQQAYFKANHGSPEKARLLDKCKKMEGDVRKKCAVMVPTLDKMTA